MTSHYLQKMGFLCLLILALTSQLHYAEASCFDDMDACLRQMRALMRSPDAFWFGQDYVDTCGPVGSFSSSPLCNNPDPGLSILSRFLASPDVTPGLADSLGMVDVTYNVPAGKYYGCGNLTEVDEVVGYRIDPLKITEINSWSLGHAPEVTWTPKDETTLYTVLIWDVGYFYAHGFYINVRGGNMQNGIGVIPYEGPKNPSMRPNIFVFMAIEQVDLIQPEEVGPILGQLLAANELRFHPMQLLQAMPGNWTVPVAVNIMSVRSDSYSIEWHKSECTINTCPLLVSQEPALYEIFEFMGLTSGWSYDINTGNRKGTFLQEKRPYLSELNVDLTVEFSSDDLTVDSCCVKTTYSKTLFRLNPFDSQTARAGYLRNAPRVQLSSVYMNDFFNRIDDKAYTLMFVDLTDASYKLASEFYIIHWLLTDIREADVYTGHEVLSYIPSVPPNRYAKRVYMFLLFEQPTSILSNFDISNYVSDSCESVIVNRCRVRIPDMMSDLNLRLAGVSWVNVEQDAFARKEMYQRIRPGPMIDQCYSLPGYEEPCPDYQICSNHAHCLMPGIGVLIAYTIVVLKSFFLL